MLKRHFTQAWCDEALAEPCDDAGESALLMPAINLSSGGSLEGAEACDPFEDLGALSLLGGEWLHICDQDGARQGRPIHHDLISELAAMTPLKVQAGGGVRTESDVEALLERGVARVVVRSLSLRHPEQVRRWVSAFGSDRICCGFDIEENAGGEVVVANHGWAHGHDLTIAEALQFYGRGAVVHALVRDVGRTQEARRPNAHLYRAIVTLRGDLRCQAAGAIQTWEDVEALEAAGVASVIVPSRFFKRIKFEVAFGR